MAKPPHMNETDCPTWAVDEGFGEGFCHCELSLKEKEAYKRKMESQHRNLTLRMG